MKTKYEKYVKYNKNWPVGTKIVFSDGVRAVFKEPEGLSTVRNGKSLLLTHFSCGDKWGDWAEAYLDFIGEGSFTISKVSLPKRKVTK
jgi:hypothetical protein